MSLRLFRYLSELHVLNVPAEKLQLYTAKGAATMINALIPVDADLLRLCAILSCEGYFSQRNGTCCSAIRERVRFQFPREMRLKYTRMYSAFCVIGVSSSFERHATHATTTIVSSRIFSWLLRDILRCGTRSEDKALPRLAFNVLPELRMELIRGAFSGDGAVKRCRTGRI